MLLFLGKFATAETREAPQVRIENGQVSSYNATVPIHTKVNVGL